MGGFSQGGIAFVLILIIALAVGLSGGGDDAAPVPTAEESYANARNAYYSKVSPRSRVFRWIHTPHMISHPISHMI